jgi:hypothetical protein
MKNFMLTVLLVMAFSVASSVGTASYLTKKMKTEEMADIKSTPCVFSWGGVNKIAIYKDGDAVLANQLMHFVKNNGYIKMREREDRIIFEKVYDTNFFFKDRCVLGYEYMKEIADRYEVEIPSEYAEKGKKVDEANQALSNTHKKFVEAN